MMQKSILALFALVLMPACARDPAPGAGEVVVQPVALNQVEARERYSVNREFAGLVTAAQSSELGFELSGKVARLGVDEGQRVTRGQVLAELDTRLLQAQRAELEARLAEIEAGIRLNAASTRRVDELEGRGFASRQSSDELDAEGDSLMARKRQVEAELEANRTRLDQSRLLAPFTAVVSRRFVDEGTVVVAGTAVYRLLQSDTLEARVGVPVEMAGRLAVGQSVPLRVAGIDMSGIVLALGNDVTQATLTLPVRIAIDQAAVPGDQAYLVLEQEIENRGFWVPLEALTDGLRGLWNVYVVTPTEDGDVLGIEARDVRVLHADADRAFVSGALRDGEQIVASGVHRLVPGQHVVAAQVREADRLQVARHAD